MYGYEPPKEMRPGGCREGLVMVRVAFEVLLPIVLAGIGAMALIALAVVLFGVHPLLGFAPIIPVIAGFWLLARRDRRLAAEQEADLERPGPPGR
jgi:hypothetical protein